MKLVSVLTASALVSVVAFIAGLSFGFGALPLFSIATSTLVLLTGASDYAPRRAYGMSTLAQSRSELSPLAA